MADTIRLCITLPDGTTDEQTFDKSSIIIGSGASAACKIDDSDVSSMHAILKRKDGDITISDLGSEAGTKVDGKSITDEVPLKAGDTIALGRVEMRLELGPAEESKDVAKKDADKPKTEEAEAQKAEDKPEVSKEVKSSEEASTDVIEDPDADKGEAEAKDESESEEKAEAKSEDEAKEKAEAKADKKPEKKAEKKADKKAEKKAKKKSEDKPKAAAAVSAKGGPVDGGLDEGLLSEPLIDSNQPTAAKHALEITVHWGDTILDEIQVFEPRGVTVAGLATHSVKGDLAVETPIPNFDGNLFTIAENHGTEASVVVPTGADVALRNADGKITRDVKLQGTDAPFPAKAYQLRFGERLAFKIGTVTFVAQYVRGDAVPGNKAPMDWFFPRIFIISALVHSFFVFAAFVTPKYSTTLTDDLFKNENRFAQMILKAPEKEKKRKKLDLSGSKGGAKHRGEEGKFGKKNKPKKDALASKAGAPRVDPNKREKDRKIAMNSGLLGILKGSGGSGAVSNVFGPGGLGTGINNAMGGLRGSAMGDAGGAGGLGTRGAGAGGGGNSLGIGGLGTHGHGRGTGGYGNIDLGGRGKGTTRIVPGRTIIKGSLSKAEIGRVIRRNLARFKYCYEKQLNANPNLSGKISVYFTIAPTGSVAKASVRETSMNDSKVERCVTKVMKSLRFPQPRGGGIVVVTYPFVFAST